MPAITPENSQHLYEYKCERCGKEAKKDDITEPDLGYISEVNKEFVKICQKCFDEIPDKGKAVKPMFETMFLVGIKPNGEGAIVKEEGVEDLFMRKPTNFDVISACKQVAVDLEASNNAERLAMYLQAIEQQKKGIKRK